MACFVNTYRWIAIYPGDSVIQFFEQPGPGLGVFFPAPDIRIVIATYSIQWKLKLVKRLLFEVEEVFS